jgi:hypothetical protein
MARRRRRVGGRARRRSGRRRALRAPLRLLPRPRVPCRLRIRARQPPGSLSPTRTRLQCPSHISHQSLAARQSSCGSSWKEPSSPRGTPRPTHRTRVRTRTCPTCHTDAVGTCCSASGGGPPARCAAELAATCAASAGGYGTLARGGCGGPPGRHCAATGPWSTTGGGWLCGGSPVTSSIKRLYAPYSARVPVGGVAVDAPPPYHCCRSSGASPACTRAPDTRTRTRSQASSHDCNAPLTRMRGPSTLRPGQASGPGLSGSHHITSHHSTERTCHCATASESPAPEVSSAGHKRCGVTTPAAAVPGGPAGRRKAGRPSRACRDDTCRVRRAQGSSERGRGSRVVQYCAVAL